MDEWIKLTDDMGDRAILLLLKNNLLIKIITFYCNILN